MKKVFLSGLLILAILGVVIGSTGCTFTWNDDVGFLKYGTLQGKIMDALTGEPVDGNGLSVYLVQGTSHRKPTTLITDANNPLLGEYAFDKIPVQIVANEITFKVVVVKTGYQRFEADVSLQAAFAGATAITDEVFNKIGNIYLFPLGSSAGDVVVYVNSPQGRPIANATVLLQQDVANNFAASYTGDRLLATAGLYPSMVETTDAAGKATFSGADSTLGGSYRLAVEPLTFDGQELAAFMSAAFMVGVDSTTRVVYMAPTGDVLFATGASNSVPGTVRANGVLTIRFNQPISLSTLDFTAVMTGDGAPSPQTVTGMLSNDGMTLTLTPTITMAPADKGAIIFYDYAGTIFLRNSQMATVYTLFTGGPNDVRNITTGGAVSGVVQLTSN